MNEFQNNSLIAQAKEAFACGKINREAFWLSINEALKNVRDLGALINERVEQIAIHKDFVSIEYRIDTRNTIQIIVPENDLRTASLSALAYGKYEGMLEDLLLDFFRKSSCFIDIGANIGFYSLMACSINTEVEVHSIEPNPIIFKVLNDNFHLNGIENRFNGHNIAIANQSTNLSFFIPKFTGSGGGSFRNLHPEEGVPDQITVKAAPFDDSFRDIKKIDLIKIDVEGAEMQVISSGIKLISKDRPTIVIELLRKWMIPFDSHPQNVLEKLVEMGYLCFAVGGARLSSINQIDDKTIETNFIFCHSENHKHLEIIKKYS